MQTITKAQATAAFEAWERDYRANPDSFFTPEEAARMEVAPLSEQRAIHFMALLRQVPATCPTCQGRGIYRPPYSSELVPCADCAACAALPSSAASATTELSANPSGSNA